MPRTLRLCRPCWPAPARHPRHDHPARPPRVTVTARDRIRPPVRACDIPHAVIRTCARIDPASSGSARAAESLDRRRGLHHIIRRDHYRGSRLVHHRRILLGQARLAVSRSGLELGESQRPEPLRLGVGNGRRSLRPGNYRPDPDTDGLRRRQVTGLRIRRELSQLGSERPQGFPAGTLRPGANPAGGARRSRRDRGWRDWSWRDTGMAACR